MSDLIEQLSSRTNIPPDQVRQGVGGLLSVLKAHGGSTYEAVTAKVPEAPGLVSAFEQSHTAAPPAETSHKGILGMIGDLASKVLGGASGEAETLIRVLSQTGLTPDQIRSLIPQVFTMLRKVLPAETIDSIFHLIPGLGLLAEPPADAKGTEETSGPAAAPAGSH